MELAVLWELAANIGPFKEIFLSSLEDVNSNKASFYVFKEVSSPKNTRKKE